MPNITYTIDKNTVSFAEESNIITSQWSYVLEQCRIKKLSEYERILLAFNTVDYKDLLAELFLNKWDSSI